jgi:hypothetical protein
MGKVSLLGDLLEDYEPLLNDMNRHDGANEAVLLDEDGLVPGPIEVVGSVKVIETGQALVAVPSAEREVRTSICKSIEVLSKGAEWWPSLLKDTGVATVEERVVARVKRAIANLENMASNV